MKKLISVIMSTVILISCLSLFSVSAFTRSGDYLYDINCGGDETTITIERYLGNETVIEVPSEIDGYTVTRLGDSCFQNSSITKITIPETVKEIYSFAFSGCSRLAEVNLPESLEVIDFCAFVGCAFETIKLPSNLKHITWGVFSGCSNLKEVDIPETVTYIGWYAFQSCSALKSVTLPNGVDYIGYGAFEYCSSLKNIYIPAATEYIGWQAFIGCNLLKDIYYGGTDEDWENIVFEYDAKNDVSASNIHFEADGIEQIIPLRETEEHFEFKISADSFEDANGDGFVNTKDILYLKKNSI